MKNIQTTMTTIKEMKRVLILFGLSILISNGSFGQHSDFEIWSSFSIKKKINNKLRADFKPGIRFNQNSTVYKKSYVDAGLKYDLNNFLALSFNYRFFQKNNYDENFSYIHRLNFDVDAKETFRRFEASARLRYQSKYTDVLRSENSVIPQNVLRTKFDLEYDFAKTSFQPKFSFEMYHGLNSENLFMQTDVRYTLSGIYKLNKKLSGKLYYRIQREKNTEDPLTSYILGVGLIYGI